MMMNKQTWWIAPLFLGIFIWFSPLPEVRAEGEEDLSPELGIHHCKRSHVDNFSHIAFHLQNMNGFPNPQKDGPGNLAFSNFLHHLVGNISGTEIRENDSINPLVPQLTEWKLLLP